MTDLNKEYEFYLHNGSVLSWGDKHGIAGVREPLPSTIRLSMNIEELHDEDNWERTDTVILKVAYFECYCEGLTP